jgi:hypothetical protein
MELTVRREQAMNTVTLTLRFWQRVRYRYPLFEKMANPPFPIVYDNKQSKLSVAGHDYTFFEKLAKNTLSLSS